MANAMGNDVVRGDTAPMPNRGTMSGAMPNMDTGGMDTGPDAINRQGRPQGSTDSDPADQCKTRDERI